MGINASLKHVAVILAVLASPVLASAQQATSDGAALIARLGLREGPTPVRELPGWAPPRRIVVHGPDAWAEPLRAAAPGAQIITAPTPDSAALILGDADVYVGICTPQIAEHTIGYILALARRLHTYRDEQRAGQWSHAIGDARVIAGLDMWELDGRKLTHLIARPS
jgi:hypothetical protein